MKKIRKLIATSSKIVKGLRADIIASQMERSHRKVVMRIEDEVDDLKDKKNSLQDIYPDSELSLRVVNKDFDSDKWAEDYQKTKLELEMKLVELKLANETTEEFFSEVEDDENTEETEK